MTTRAKILIVDDEKPLRDTLARWFKPDYDCLTAPDASEAMRMIGENPDLALMISDVRMPGENGVELLKKAKAANPTMATILLTAYGTVDLAVEAMKEGADDFFQKPITDMAAFELRVAKALRTSALEKEVASLKSQLGAELENFTGKSPAMQKVYTLIRKVAPTDATILVEGPSGSGKELAARAIHNLSRRANKPYVAVECSALSENLLESELFGYEAGAFTGANARGHVGHIESADGGTLFLDEIGEISKNIQVKLLRALETKTIKRVGGTQDIAVDFRLVAATNRNLAQMVAAGDFREDLYYRLNVIDVHMPALKDHPEDVALLVARFIREFATANGSKVAGIEPAALKALEDYAWPGNVRQLRNVIEKMVVLATETTLTTDDLPVEITGSAASPQPKTATNEQQAETNAPTAATTLAESEKAQILAALEACGGNKSRAAEQLGISRRTLHRKLNEWERK